MRRVGVAALRNQLSKHLRSVERGARVLVLDGDRAIAQIVPVPPGPQEAVLEPARRALAPEDRRPGPPCDWAVSSLELLREERGDR